MAMVLHTLFEGGLELLNVFVECVWRVGFEDPVDVPLRADQLEALDDAFDVDFFQHFH